MTHQRWVCRDCEREWLYAHHWTPEQGCPACRSMQVEQVTYQAAFPGADVPRSGATEMSAVAPVAPVVQKPPTALIADEERNWAIELSGMGQ